MCNIQFLLTPIVKIKTFANLFKKSSDSLIYICTKRKKCMSYNFSSWRNLLVLLHSNPFNKKIFPMTSHKSHHAKTSFYLPTPSPFPDKNSCLEKSTKILNKCRRTSFLYAKGGTSIVLLHGSFCTQNWD